MGALSKEEGAGPNASKIVLTSAFLQYVALPGSLRPAASASQRSLTASSPLPAPSLPSFAAATSAAATSAAAALTAAGAGRAGG